MVAYTTISAYQNIKANRLCQKWYNSFNTALIHADNLNVLH